MPIACGAALALVAQSSASSRNFFGECGSRASLDADSERDDVTTVDDPQLL
jgi:hypothetical protein